MHDWPHSPVHRLSEAGTFVVTAGTYHKELFFRSANRLDMLCGALLQLAGHYAWRLQAWAVFPNHYHFVAISPPRADSLREFIQHLHSLTAREMNRLDHTSGRKVWFDYWDTRLTRQKSFLARFSYVHRNPLHHGLVKVPSAYSWCSAGWFERKARLAFYRTVMRFPTERVTVPDDYDLPPESIA